jgi:hypothetical protein
MKPISNTPLVLAFIIVVTIFLLFCGGAITMTLLNDGMNNSMNHDMHNNGMTNNISWMWIPTIIAFLLSGLLGWVIFGKKND